MDGRGGHSPLSKCIIVSRAVDLPDCFQTKPAYDKARIEGTPRQVDIQIFEQASGSIAVGEHGQTATTSATSE